MVEAATDRTSRPHRLQSFVSTSLVNFFYSLDINIQLLVSTIQLYLKVASDYSAVQFGDTSKLFLFLQMSSSSNFICVQKEKGQLMLQQPSDAQRSYERQPC